jgi:hypothetical protein
MSVDFGLGKWLWDNLFGREKSLNGLNQDKLGRCTQMHAFWMLGWLSSLGIA